MRVGFWRWPCSIGAAAPAAAAEWQVKPWVGLTFGGGTSLVGDLEFAAGSRKVAAGS